MASPFPYSSTLLLTLALVWWLMCIGLVIGLPLKDRDISTLTQLDGDDGTPSDTMVLVSEVVMEGGGSVPAQSPPHLIPQHPHHHRGRAHRKGRNGDKLFLQSNYYTMLTTSNHTQFTLKIKLNGKIEWVEGTPTLYSVFREQVIHERSSGERMYTLEATASRYWICMNDKGRLYTIHRTAHFNQRGRQRGGRVPNKIRHEEHKGKRKGGRWRKRAVVMGTSEKKERQPPSDCLFKTHEFNTRESYEGAVGIYSFPHSNQTHARFLSLNQSTGEPRGYRKAFRNLYRHAQVKITQVPINTILKEMVNSTRFSRDASMNGAVKQCILHLFTCHDQQSKLRRRHAQFYRIIERCRRRAVRTSSPPKCKNSPQPSKRNKKNATLV